MKARIEQEGVHVRRHGLRQGEGAFILDMNHLDQRNTRQALPKIGVGCPQKLVHDLDRIRSAAAMLGDDFPDILAGGQQEGGNVRAR